jgi:hypothetical protein
MVKRFSTTLATREIDNEEDNRISPARAFALDDVGGLVATRYLSASPPGPSS